MNNNYYKEHLNDFINNTSSCDMSDLYHFFLSHLKQGKVICDLGFGSGRDSLYFNSIGYEVYSIDPLEEFCNNAKSLGLKNVYQLTAQQLNFDNLFDGIWACASLLHVPSNELNDVFKRCYKSLKDNGVMYVSFKYGEYEGERDGRFFIDLNEESFKQYIKDTGLEIIDTKITIDVRPEKATKWLNVILYKKQ